MTATLNEHARHRRWCSRSKRWWNDELRDLRATLGRAKRTCAELGPNQKRAAQAEKCHPQGQEGLLEQVPAGRSQIVGGSSDRVAPGGRHLEGPRDGGTFGVEGFLAPAVLLCILVS